MRNQILCQLEELGLAELNGRPFDCAHEIFLKEKSQRRLVLIGFNGSDADKHWTNKNSIIDGFDNPKSSNVHHGANGAWLSKTLPNRLLQLPIDLDYEVENTIYTNAIMLCSANAATIKQRTKEVGLSIDELVNKSLSFFENITISNSNIELIIAYSNSMNDLSAASAIYQRFGNSDIYISNQNNYYKTFSFSALIADKKIPVVCIRHLSRFKPNIISIRDALSKQLENL